MSGVYYCVARRHGSLSDAARHWALLASRGQSDERYDTEYVT